MNFNTYMGILRAVVPGAVGFAAGKGWITQDQVADIVTAIVTLGAAGWSIVTNIEGKK